MLTRTMATAAIAAGLIAPTADAAMFNTGDHSAHALKTMHGTKHTSRKHIACKRGSTLHHGKCYVLTAKKRK